MQSDLNKTEGDIRDALRKVEDTKQMMGDVGERIRRIRAAPDESEREQLPVLEAHGAACLPFLLCFPVQPAPGPAALVLPHPVCCACVPWRVFSCVASTHIHCNPLPVCPGCLCVSHCRWYWPPPSHVGAPIPPPPTPPAACPQGQRRPAGRSQVCVCVCCQPNPIRGGWVLRCRWRLPTASAAAVHRGTRSPHSPNDS